MNTCDTCKHWGESGFTTNPNGHNPCMHPKVDMPDGQDEDGIDSNADYDYGITTGPKFGCIHWEGK